MKKRQKKKNLKITGKKILIFNDVMIANCLICGVANLLSVILESHVSVHRVVDFIFLTNCFYFTVNGGGGYTSLFGTLFTS